jgi:vacuolar-type H+-ATPase subunit H
LVQSVEREAAAQRSAAEEEARKIRLKGQQDAALILTEAHTKAARLTDELQQARQAFEGQRATIARHAAAQAASVAVQVVLGVLTGKVTRRPDGAGWQVHDDALRQKVEALDLGPVLGEVISKVAALWERLLGRLTATDVATERQSADATLSPIKQRSPDEGMSP